MKNSGLSKDSMWYLNNFLDIKNPNKELKKILPGFKKNLDSIIENKDEHIGLALLVPLKEYYKKIQKSITIIPSAPHSELSGNFIIEMQEGISKYNQLNK